MGKSCVSRAGGPEPLGPYSERLIGKSVKCAAWRGMMRDMAWNIHGRKTEHAGAKHGSGAYWGPKAVAKRASNTERRRNAHGVVAAAIAEVEHPETAVRVTQTFRGTRRTRRNTRRWCAGKVGREHAFILQETLGVTLGLPPLHVWRCTRCGRKAYNLKQRRDGATVAVEGDGALDRSA